MRVCIMAASRYGRAPETDHYVEEVPTTPSMTLGRVAAEAQRLFPAEFAKTGPFRDTYDAQGVLLAFASRDDGHWVYEVPDIHGLTVPAADGILYFDQPIRTVTVAEFQEGCRIGILPYMPDRIALWNAEGLGNGEDLFCTALGSWPVLLEVIGMVVAGVAAGALVELIKSYFADLKHRNGQPQHLGPLLDVAVDNEWTLEQLSRALGVDDAMLQAALPALGAAVDEATRRVVRCDTDESARIGAVLERTKHQPFWEYMDEEQIQGIIDEEEDLRRAYQWSRDYQGLRNDQEGEDHAK